jgi:ABC-2 type transport system ATP-binding protein
LTKIIYPDTGSIEIRGRVSSLLELGAGFHPDLSGYENIYLNAAVFGLSRKEIERRLEEIIRFSELEGVIYNPIRTYSSGMYMKLAFSIAINVNADILLIDEILGVGDVNFQKKCFDKLLEIKKNGTTIAIVSHSTDQIEKICDRSIWIEDGKVKCEGVPREVHEQYLAKMYEKRLLRIKKEEEEREINYLNSKEKKERSKQKLQEEAESQKQQEYIEQMLVEKEKQQIALQKADERRLQLLTLGAESDRRSHDSDQFSYLKNEKERLEVVVQEKEFELDRLEAVIREKAAELGQIELRIRRIIQEKDTEIQKLKNELYQINKEDSLL